MKKMGFVAAVAIAWCLAVLLSGNAQAAGRTDTCGIKQERVKNTKRGKINDKHTGKTVAGGTAVKHTGTASVRNTEKTERSTKYTGKCRNEASGMKNTLTEKLKALVKRDVTYSAASNHHVGKTISGKVKRYTEEELRYMTCIIYCEARGECYAGKKAVGIVVMNRVKDENFPDTVEDVIYQSGQFTPARTGSLSNALAIYDRQEKNGRVKGTMKKCMKAAKSALTGSTTVQVRGRQKQMKNYLFFSRYIPNAAYSIGAHQFK